MPVCGIAEISLQADGTYIPNAYIYETRSKEDDNTEKCSTP